MDFLAAVCLRSLFSCWPSSRAAPSLRRVSRSVVFDSLGPPPRLLCPWGSPGKKTGVGGHFLLQGKALGSCLQFLPHGPCVYVTTWLLVPSLTRTVSAAAPCHFLQGQHRWSPFRLTQSYFDYGLRGLMSSTVIGSAHSLGGVDDIGCTHVMCGNRGGKVVGILGSLLYFCISWMENENRKCYRSLMGLVTTSTLPV